MGRHQPHLSSCSNAFRNYTPSLLAMQFLVLMTGCTSPTQAWHRSELFFGGNRPDGTPITDAEWKTFVDEQLTPAFPAGLTVVPASGQWREEGGSVTRESTHIVILLYPKSDERSADASISSLVSAYCHLFHQRSVLRTDRTEDASFPTSQPFRK